jgi:hypothetical protein
LIWVARNRYRWFSRRDTCILPNSSNMTEALAGKTRAPVAGEYLHFHPSKLRSFTHRRQIGNWRRRLTASSGASGFEALTFLPNIGELTRF